MGTWTVVSQQRQVMTWVGESSHAAPFGGSPLDPSVFKEPRFGALPRVEQVLVPAVLEKELGAESTPPDPAGLVVEGEGHLASTVLTTHPPLNSLRFQFNAATNCRSCLFRSGQVQGRSERGIFA